MRKIALTMLTIGMLATGSTVLSGSAAMAQDEASNPQITAFYLSHGHLWDTSLHVASDGAWSTWAPGPADHPRKSDEGNLSVRQKTALNHYGAAALKEANPAGLDGCKSAYNLTIVTGEESRTMRGCLDDSRLDAKTPNFNATVKVLLKATTYDDASVRIPSPSEGQE